MIEAFISFLKSASPRVVFALAITSGCALLAPPEFIERLGLTEAVSENRPIIGGAFLLFGSLSLFNIGDPIVKLAKRPFNRWMRRRRVARTLLALTGEEKAILAMFILGNRNTLYFTLQNGVVNGLVAQGLLYRASQISRPYDMKFAYNLQPVARSVLDEVGDIYFAEVTQNFDAEAIEQMMITHGERNPFMG